MILLSVLKINLALAFETLVLIAAIFLLLNIKKQEVSKWFRYSVYVIILFLLGLMACTIASGCCHRGGMDSCKAGKMEKVCIKKEMKMGHHGMMEGCGKGPSCCMKMKGSDCMKMRGEGMSCCKEMEEEEMGEKSCCKKGMHGDASEEIEKDTVIIKKK